MHLARCFFTAENSFWTHQFWGPFSASAIFYFTSSTCKTFPFEDFFHLGKQKQVAQGDIGWIRKIGHGGHAFFGQKLLNTQHNVGRCAPLLKHWVLRKKFTEAKGSLSQQRHLVHQYRWVPRTLTKRGKLVL